MSATSINRRTFLKSSGAITGSLAFAGGPIAVLAPSNSWALELGTLDSHTGATLLRFARVLYPHDTLEDAVYALVIKDLDIAAKADADTAKLLRDGVAGLDAAADGSWLEADAEKQLKIATEQESTPFFAKMRSTTVVSLYNNELAFAHFGYEGAAFAKGGYIGRGFNDLDWLPEPDAAASPAV